MCQGFRCGRRRVLGVGLGVGLRCLRCPERGEAAHLASVVTRPSLPVLVQLLRWQFMLSSASSSLPR